MESARQFMLSVVLCASSVRPAALHAPACARRGRVGYLSLRDDAANVLHHVVNGRYLKRRPMIFTTNKSLNAWGEILHDPDLAAAIIDRTLEKGRLVSLDGTSRRTNRMDTSADSLLSTSGEKTARTSGTHATAAEAWLWEHRGA